MNRLEKKKKGKMFVVSLIIGYVSTALFVSYLVYLFVCMFNKTHTVLVDSGFLMSFILVSLMIIMMVFGLFIPVDIDITLKRYRDDLQDRRDNNRMVTAINHIKNGKVNEAVDVANTIRSPKRKSFVMGLVIGIAFSSQYEDQRNLGLTRLNSFTYK